LRNYYELLGLKPSASQREIKQAFRGRAKRLHPDVTGESPESSRAMRDLLMAYETLSKPEARREYDIACRKIFERFSFDYRAYLKSKPNDFDSQAKLIFYDLLHGWEDEALEVFDTHHDKPGFALDRWLDREDAMDCAFLLAEEYENRKRFLEAFGLYRWCVLMELRKPYFRHFFPEITFRLGELVRVRLPRIMSDEALLPYLQVIIDLGLSDKETARFYRHRAELGLKLGRTEQARSDLVCAIKLDHGMNRLRQLKKKVGIE
jgi:hypothetical protein